jgi:hypothetical protein
MLRVLLKLVVACAVVVASYYAFQYGMAYRQALLAARCATPEEFALVSSPSTSSARKWEVTARIYSCLREQQNFLDRLFWSVPKRWTEPTPPT